MTLNCTYRAATTVTMTVRRKMTTEIASSSFESSPVSRLLYPCAINNFELQHLFEGRACIYSPPIQMVRIILGKERTKLLRKTRLQVRVIVEVLHCKNPKHQILEIIDVVSPTLVVVGSRGQSALKG